MEDVQIPCAVLQRFILIDPQFISCFSDLKYFTVIFFVKQGSKFGVKIRSEAPSIHMIRANIETEIAPIVGTEEQAKDLLDYIAEQGGPDKDGIWDTNIFGKTVRQLVDEGMSGKVNKLTQESQLKLQETIQKVINDSNGGLVCIII